MTVAEFARALRAREITSEQTTERCLAVIRARNDELRAFTLVLEKDAIEQARQADRELASGQDRGPLHGVPISIKDLIDVRGTVTTAASAVRASAPAATEDAPAIAHLRDAGAVFVGKTNLHEFALGTTSEDTVFGAVRNPLDTTRSAGGSSGGSAVSIVTGMALASVGTDTGGSIRIPASACGLTGLKPSYGEVSTDGVIPLSPRLDHVGPLAQSTGDAWMLFRILAGEMHPAVQTAATPGDIRLRVLRRYFCDLLDDEVRSRFEGALDALRGAGMQASDHVLKHAHVTSPVYLKIAPREAFLLHQPTLDATPEKYTPAVRQRLELGRGVSHDDFLKALNVQADLRDDVDMALKDCDALVLPTMPIPAPTLGAETVRIGETDHPTRAMTLRNTQLFNLTGHPAISIPCGKTDDGLPVGLQLVGHHGRTDALVRIALACEALLRDPERVALRRLYVGRPFQGRHLRGHMTDRMPPIPKEQWTGPQAKAAAEFARMRGQDVFGPFALMLRSPEVMLRAAAMGDYMRYKTSLPRPLNEMIILLTARHWSQQFEWYIHQPMALAAGLSETIVSAISKGRRPEGMSSDEAIVYDFSTELLRLQNISDETYAKAKALFGEPGIIDMVGVAGYYSFLSMMMNTARTAVPADSDVPPLP